MRVAAAAIVVAVSLTGCTEPPRAGSAAAPAPAGGPPARAATRTATATAAEDEDASGSGIASNQAPPQRRFRLVTEAGGGLAAFRMRVVEESNATALPGAGEPVRIPEPPPIEKRPDREGPPPVIAIPPPH